MGDLRESLTAAGFSSVDTLLQTGNVLVDAGSRSPRLVAGAVRKVIASGFGIETDVIARTGPALEACLAANPYISEEPDRSRLHMIFLETAPGPEVAAALDPLRSPPDRFTVQDDVIQLHYPDGMGRSKLGLDYFERTLGTRGTARNWNTVSRVSVMLQG
jgi:uncharacterized protein (DUF1697 family)